MKIIKTRLQEFYDKYSLTKVSRLKLRKEYVNLIEKYLQLKILIHSDVLKDYEFCKRNI
jgi:hypothetical protein